MDSISASIIAALGSGLSKVGTKLVVDTYEMLKKLLKQKYGDKSDVVEAVEKLEEKPKSKGRQATLQEEIESAKAMDNTEVKRLAEELLQAINETPEGKAVMNEYNINAGKIGVVIQSGGTAKIEKQVF